ncbi:EmrB/QacA subfamily drug resistance transporter [Paenibacillus cellulosilyticus]|uniref:EmrB/QacA subfamily drug resistance transporter n=2 Tax=Paenibacillus cellulosilyticus TaxID=375489 RepID=A0A2V2YRJ0_9BACL|nr:EmrB/QacA subfamily drug resistance transporter [Paenibacillus cellulosilyticus]QKS46492.1 MFS transporter [Paenibacillus cellulosilyticus]
MKLKVLNLHNSKTRWWVLAVLALSVLTIGLDTTVLNLALPVLATDLDATTSQLQWFANAYNLVLAAMLLPAGMLGDRYSRKKLLLLSLVMFGAASVACAYSSTSEALIISRAILGLGAALLMPLSLSLIPFLFAEQERPKAMTLWVTASALGLPLGPILGGWLLEHYNWGTIFLINVPIIIVALAALMALLPESTAEKRKQRIDWSGIVASSLGLTAITYGVTRSGDEGWNDGITLVSVIVGVLLLGVFIWLGRRSAHPLVDMKLFGRAGFTWGASLATLVNFSLFGILFGLPLYLQVVQGFDAQAAGLRILPLIGGVVVGSRLSGLLSARAGEKLTIALGFLIVTTGFGLAGLTEVSTGYGYTAAWLVCVGVGLSFVLPVAMNAAIGALPEDRAGVGSAVIMAMRQIGGTIGVAFLGALLNSIYSRNVDVSALPDATAEAVHHNVSSGVIAASELNDASLLKSVHEAFVSGLDVMMFVCGGIAIVGVALTVLFWPRKVEVVKGNGLEQ